MSFRVGILTISDMGARGEREDTSGQVIRELLSSIDAAVDNYEIIPDEGSLIAERLIAWSDVTPEATRAAIDHEVPGIAEAMRAEGLKHTSMSMISRAVAGVRGQTLIINLPGSPKGVRENLELVLPVLTHAIELLGGERSEHNPA